jgi:hypothetical protein
MKTFEVILCVWCCCLDDGIQGAVGGVTSGNQNMLANSVSSESLLQSKLAEANWTLSRQQHGDRIGDPFNRLD